ncbi:hypothetical protein LJR030_000449 [Rhizobium sp. LjRoot30]
MTTTAGEAKFILSQKYRLPCGKALENGEGQAILHSRLPKDMKITA